MTEQSLLSLPTRIRGNHSNKYFKTLNVLTNHYSIQFSKDIKNIFIFKVMFTPMIPTDNADLRKKLFNELYEEIEKQIDNPVFTGYNIYSTEPPKEIQKSYTFKEYNVVIKQVKQYDMSSNPKLLLGFLNNGLRNIMSKLNFVQIGKSGKYFNSKDSTKIDDLIMYNGYKSNFVSLEKGVFLRIDPAKKIVRNQTVLQFIDDFYLSHKESSKEEKRNLIKVELIGKIIMSNYGQTRYHKIIDLEFKDIEGIMLQNEVSLLQYYQQKYKIKIKSLKQPLIVIEGRDKEKPTYLFPQLMLMTGIPQNFDQFRRKKISQRTIKDPSQKMKEIEGLMDRLITANEVKALNQLGLKLNKNLQRIEAKQIPIPVLQLGKNNSVDKGREAFFQLFNKPIYSAKHDIPCAIISMRNTDIREVISTFEKTSHNLGVKMIINCYTFSNASVNLVQNQIDKSLENGSKICLIVLPVSLKSSYKSIKIATLKDGVVTQCMTEMTLRKKNLQSIATKVLLQIIVKRGNILWRPTLSMDFSGMLVGFEQTKVGKGVCLTLCSTINTAFNMIYSANKHFQGLENKYTAMSELLLKSIDSYSKRNKGVPQEIICFQNSCPDDQIRLYHELFINPTLQKVKTIYDNQSIPLTVVMINSKTSERFFAKNNGDRPQNVGAGTLISQEVVSANYDFYLISQQTTRGTVVPNHYKIIYSDSKMEEGILQEIAFSQCFNYANWTGSIKVPGVLQYAKKLSKFKAEVLAQIEAPEQLSTRLYFI